jgi:hypothetical protein
MRLKPYFDKGMMPTVSQNDGSSIPLAAFTFGPAGVAAQGLWAEIYRMAHERTVEALRPTRYDHALRASAN